MYTSALPCMYVSVSGSCNEDGTGSTVTGVFVGW